MSAQVLRGIVTSSNVDHAIAAMQREIASLHTSQNATNLEITSLRHDLAILQYVVSLSIP
jgi:hypothetical protein